MLAWYFDKNLAIEFSSKPLVGTRYPMPSMSDDEIKSIKKYPFINRKELYVELTDIPNNITYTFTIPKGYCWDGATIPRVFWRIIGSSTAPEFLIASLIHDVLCENHNYVDNDRYFADKVFERLLYVAKVPAFQRWLMFHSVDNYQKLCGWRAESEKISEGKSLELVKSEPPSSKWGDK